jgi:hypothetical protein
MYYPSLASAPPASNVGRMALTRPLLASPEAAEELPHVADQEVGDLHSGEVAAFVELRPMGHGALGIHHTPEALRRRVRALQETVSIAAARPQAYLFSLSITARAARGTSAGIFGSASYQAR